MRRPKILSAIVGIGCFVSITTYIFLTKENVYQRVLLTAEGSINGVYASPEKKFAGYKTKTSSAEGFSRSYNIKKACKKLGKRVQREKATVSQFRGFVYNDKYKIITCLIPKVATTNWGRIYLILSGKMNTTDTVKIPSRDVHGSLGIHLNFLSHLDLPAIKYRLKNYLKVMIVREPFERLLSAYRNKLGADSSTNHYFHKRFGRRIIKKFRTKPTNKSLELGHDVKFREFVSYILDPGRDEPLNGHWELYHKMCLPCIINYDHIVKYESLTEDSNKILEKIGASTLVKFPSRSKSYHNTKTSSLMYDYYKTLSPATITKLWKFYYPDFMLFNYTLPKSLHNLTSIVS